MSTWRRMHLALQPWHSSIIGHRPPETCLQLQQCRCVLPA